MTALRDFGRRLLPLALRSEAHWLSAHVRAKTALARLWNWEAAELCGPDRPYRVVYVGLTEHKELASSLFKLGRTESRSVEPRFSASTAVATHATLPHALRVPLHVQMMVPLRHREQVLDRFDVALRRRTHAQRSQYTVRQVHDLDEMDLLTDTMLEPYARARRAEPVTRDIVRRIALGDGRLDVLSKDGIPLGCALGFPRWLPDANVWELWRVGYPAEVFNDARVSSEVNAMTVFVDLERVMEERFDYYDMGSCIAQPDDNLLQWKRRRGGAPSASHSHDWLSVMLPQKNAALLLWDSPLFAADRGRLSLWLGLPAQRTDDELLERCRFLRFDGLARVRLCAERALGRGFGAALKTLFNGGSNGPELSMVRVAA